MVIPLALRTLIVMLASLACFFAKPVNAQDRAGTLQGVIKDIQGAPVTGAFVKMHNAERRLTFMVISQETGRYAVNTLPRGKYTVQAVGGEFQSESSAPTEVAPGAPASVELALTVTRAPQLAPAWPGRLPGERGGEADESRQGPPPIGWQRKAGTFQNTASKRSSFIFPPSRPLRHSSQVKFSWL